MDATTYATLWEVAKLTVSLSALSASVAALRIAIVASRRQRRPVLVFEYSQESGWSVRNVGSGPALNVMVARRSSTGNWDQAVRLPAAAANAAIPLGWLMVSAGDEIVAEYSDYESQLYGSRYAAGRVSVSAEQWLPADVIQSATEYRQLR
jgi:hypothetical protein